MTQNFVDRTNDPDQARRITREGIAELKEQAERIPERARAESRTNKEKGKRLAKEERARADCQVEVKLGANSLLMAPPS